MDGEPEAYVDDSLRSIGISPRERLARIESLLVTMDSKLDNKANRADVLALETRVWEIEVRGTAATNIACEEAKRLAAEREADHKELQEHVARLRADHEALSKRIAWGFGALTVAAIVAEYILGHVIG
jgi:hypothetical protein